MSFTVSSNDFAEMANIVGEAHPPSHLSVAVTRNGSPSAVVAARRYDSAEGLVASVTEVFTLADLQRLARWILDQN